MSNGFTPSAGLRRLADLIGCDLAEVADTEALADELRRRPNVAQRDCLRQVPVEWGADGFTVLDDPNLYSGWTAADREGLHTIQRATAKALKPYFSAQDVAWIAEEVLWQIRALLVRGQTVRIPQLGDLALQLDGTLAARAVPGLAREDGRL